MRLFAILFLLFFFALYFMEQNNNNKNEIPNTEIKKKKRKRRMHMPDPNDTSMRQFSDRMLEPFWIEFIKNNFSAEHIEPIEKKTNTTKKREDN